VSVVQQAIDDAQLFRVERGEQVKQPDLSYPWKFRLPLEEAEHCGDTFDVAATDTRRHYVIVTRQEERLDAMPSFAFQIAANNSRKCGPAARVLARVDERLWLRE
jgi:hypothetical protein